VSTHDGEKSGKISDSMTGYKSTECVLVAIDWLSVRSAKILENFRASKDEMSSFFYSP